MTAPRFLWNGVRVDGRLILCHYSLGGLRPDLYPAETITIYAREYGPQLSSVPGISARDCSDMQTDYFETEHARVLPDDPLYSAVYAAWRAAAERAEMRILARGRKAHAAGDGRKLYMYQTQHEQAYYTLHGTTAGAREAFDLAMHGSRQ